MSFVGAPFEHDIFFSYAHADVDRDGDSVIKEWCQQFARDLRNKIQIFPEFAPLSLFLDETDRHGERLDETAELTGALEKASQRAALLCAMMSPWYLKSPWCTREREWWTTGTQQLAPAIDQAFDRAFICRLMDTDESAWPAEFMDSEEVTHKGFWLFDRAKPRFERVPLGMIGTSDDQAAYKEVVVRVAGLLAKRLDEIRERLAAEREAEAAMGKLLEDTGQTIYLHGRPELGEVFEQTFERLQDAAYAVLPLEPAPLPRDGRFDASQESDLDMADAMLVLGKAHQRLDADIVVAGRNARRLAQARSYKKLPCAVFDVDGQNNHPPKRLTNAQNLGIEWIDATSTDWHNRMRGWLLQATETASVTV